MDFNTDLVAVIDELRKDPTSYLSLINFGKVGTILNDVVLLINASRINPILSVLNSRDNYFATIPRDIVQFYILPHFYDGCNFLGQQHNDTSIYGVGHHPNVATLEHDGYSVVNLGRIHHDTLPANIRIINPIIGSIPVDLEFTFLRNHSPYRKDGPEIVSKNKAEWYSVDIHPDKLISYNNKSFAPRMGYTLAFNHWRYNGPIYGLSLLHTMPFDTVRIWLNKYIWVPKTRSFITGKIKYVTLCRDTMDIYYDDNEITVNFAFLGPIGANLIRTMIDYDIPGRLAYEYQRIKDMEGEIRKVYTDLPEF